MNNLSMLFAKGSELLKLFQFDLLYKLVLEPNIFGFKLFSVKIA